MEQNICNCSYCKTIYSFVNNEILPTEQNNIEPQSKSTTPTPIYNNFVYPTETLIINDIPTSENNISGSEGEMSNINNELPGLIDEDDNVYPTIDNLFNKLIDTMNESLTNNLLNYNPIIEFIYIDPDYISSLDFGEDIINVFDNSVDVNNYIINTFMENKNTYIDIYNDYITRFKLYLYTNSHDEKNENYNLTETEHKILLNDYNKLNKWIEILKQEWVEW